ncbi:fimbria/pilus outer membrane usher protein [Acinetobacter sp. Lyrl_1]|uniref:fimbria/pilus outer membrane usher protein n=1 Tax=Acinetobacter sp. Lyrl_1 TaxID=3110920 RepID=UPI003F7BB299
MIYVFLPFKVHVKKIELVKPFSVLFTVLCILPFSSDLNAAQNTTNNSKQEIQERYSNAAETYLVEIIINAQPLPDIYRVEKLADGHIALPLDVWELTRLRPVKEITALPDAQKGYILDSITGLTYQFDRSLLTLEINAPAQAFKGSFFDMRSQKESLPNLSPPGAFINYNLSVTDAVHHEKNYGALIEGIVFNGWGSAVIGGVIRSNKNETETIRTETYWQKDLPNRMQSLTIGDTLDPGSDWSRPARFAGIRWGRDFTLQPGYISYPMPSLSGSAALPSTIDVLVNNQRRQTQTVKSGPFDLTNIPVITGAGEINLIIRNMLGEQTIITRSYYTSPKLLESGLTDFSFQAGFLRENYGTVSNDYGAFFSSSNWRQGLSKTTTVEGRLELQQDRQAIGGLVDHVLGNFAIAHLGVGFSHVHDNQGGHYLMGLERTGKNGGGSIRWEYFSDDYNQFASTDKEIKPRQRIAAGYGLPIYHNVSIGLNYTSQSNWNSDLLSLLSANVSISLPENIFLHTYASTQLDQNKDWNCGLSLTIPLGKQRSFSANSQRSNDGHYVNTADLTQSAPIGPGIGWGIRTSDNPNQKLRANFTWNTKIGQITAEAVDNSQHDAMFRFGASGSIGWLQNLPFATKNIGHGSFAVVKVADFERIPVYRSNQLVAYTNSQGLAFVPNLLPYQKNKISLDPSELPLEAEINGTEEYALPYARSGIFLNLPVRRSYNALITLKQPDNSPVPLGATVKLAGRDDEFVVGKRGEVYLVNLSKVNHITVTWPTGSCKLKIPLDFKGSGEPRIGPLACGN